jgi:hypothetical protein
MHASSILTPSRHPNANKPVVSDRSPPEEEGAILFRFGSRSPILPILLSYTHVKVSSDNKLLASGPTIRLNDAGRNRLLIQFRANAENRNCGTYTVQIYLPNTL